MFVVLAFVRSEPREAHWRYADFGRPSTNRLSYDCRQFSGQNEHRFTTQQQERDWPLAELDSSQSLISQRAVVHQIHRHPS